MVLQPTMCNDEGDGMMRDAATAGRTFVTL